MWESHTELPRSVPLLVHLALRTGGVISQMGWFFLGFGLIFAHIFVPWDGLKWVTGSAAETPGAYIGSEGTGAHENDRPVIRHKFRYSVDGTEYHGESYTTGSGNVADSLTVEYLESDPAISVIKGQRDSMFGPVAAIVMIFPLVGFFMLLPGIWSGARTGRLLAHGKVTRGTLVSKEATNTRINNRTVMKYTFRFTDELGDEYTAVGRTHTGELEDEETETILYDPSNPANACTVDNLPGRPRVEDGLVRPGSTIGAMLTLVVPLATIVGHTAWFVLAG